MKESTLKRVRKPARYIGGEVGSVVKDPEKVDVHMAFAFPDLYEVGMSHLGLHLLYSLINSHEAFFCERVFAPDRDLEEIIRRGEEAFSTLETSTPLRDLDILGFTLQYELSYTNILNMLSLAGIPLRSSDRAEDMPLIIAGGPCAFNPEPMAPFFDLFVIGDGEEVTVELMKLYAASEDKESFLKKACQLRGVYVPAFYEETYEDGHFVGHRVLYEQAPYPVQKALITSLAGQDHPVRHIVPFMDTVHDRAFTEIFRGCTQGCRFCQAGMIYRPVRERSKEQVLRNALRLLDEGGYEEVALTSLSSLDHSEIREIVEELHERTKHRNIRLSLPSLRLDSISLDVLRRVSGPRRSSLTFAPEAGTQRMRDVINKNVEEEDIFSSAKALFEEGWSKLKLYFMLGLPTETFEDVKGIAHIARELRALYKETTGSDRLKLSISTSYLIPKPFTPFQWLAMTPKDVVEERQQYLSKALRSRQYSYSYHEGASSNLEAVLARGSRKIADAIERAFEHGAVFDGWNDYFRWDLWLQAFEECGIDIEKELGERGLDDPLPWDIIDPGVTKSYLKKEWAKALEEETTADCRGLCHGCGINSPRTGGICFGVPNPL
ncbi:MAG TPA: TIGR03960 family B12-binding radical SAM protein [Tissierellia bacterium]|nr:TIGR03960 family B12-binding radical SAM protein [Tissierellia bacterium]